MLQSPSAFYGKSAFADGIIVCLVLYRKVCYIDYNDYMMAKSEKAFRRAALLRSKTALLFCHILIAMSIGRMIFRIIRC
ncbi:MAG: hypothetical protein IKI69_09335, partial [Oscillospiraceae bacterium]|nr:hypothetical protein [Oscillospiraceae bacterium]